jgi:hypothetical protein
VTDLRGAEGGESLDHVSTQSMSRPPLWWIRWLMSFAFLRVI